MDAGELPAILRARFPQPGATTLDRLIEMDGDGDVAESGGAEHQLARE